MIGMPTYGRSFTLVDPTKFDIGAPASGGGEPGKYTAEAGFMSYYEVSRSIWNFMVFESAVLAILFLGQHFQAKARTEKPTLRLKCSQPSELGW